MTNERKALLLKLMGNVFTALNELSDTITEADFEWADKVYDEGDGDIAVGDEEIVMQILNLREDVSDYVKNML
jgi:hypothetical protein